MLEWVRSYADREGERLWAKALEVCDILKERHGESAYALAEQIKPGSPGAARLGDILLSRTSYHYGDSFNAATFAWAVEQAAA